MISSLHMRKIDGGGAEKVLENVSLMPRFPVYTDLRKFDQNYTTHRNYPSKKPPENFNN